jgi:hypothetical protein
VLCQIPEITGKKTGLGNGFTNLRKRILDKKESFVEKCERSANHFADPSC